MQLRPKQIAAVESVLEQWKEHQAVIGVAATGFGKTQVFCELIKRRLPSRSLILVHREELCTQAVKRLSSFGLKAEIEKAEQYATGNLFDRTPVVVATVQTLISGRNGSKRMTRFDPKDFSTLIVDETHHAVAESWQAVIRYFIHGNPEMRCVGVTATPDRTDNISLAKLFSSVAFDVEIDDLIRDGWLVGIDQRYVAISSLDLSNVRTKDGDLNGLELANVLEFERTLLGMADATRQIAGDKRTLVFCASVKQAERMAEIFNRYKPNSTACVFGHTPADSRKEVFSHFSTGKIQVLCNVGVATEGYDNPGIELIVMARPTKSRCLYAQMLGRGTRPLDGVVSDEQPDAATRCASILASAKQKMIVLDFVGNSGRHKLISSSDILGGKISEEARAVARKKVELKGSGDMLDELAIAEKEIREREEASKRKGITAAAKFEATYVDPFDVFSKRAEKWKGFKQKRPLTEKQRAIMIKHGYNPDDYSPAEGQAIITKIFGPTDKQVRKLLQAGYTADELDGLNKWEVSKMLDVVAKNHWKRPPKSDNGSSKEGEVPF